MKLDNVVKIIKKDNTVDEEANLMKKEKEVLNYEISNLREKLIEIQDKTQEIQNKIQKPTNIQNYKLLDRLIDGFTEELTVYWEDLVELLIEELLIEEVKILNKIEREKNNKLADFEELTSFINENANSQINSNKAKNMKQPYNFYELKGVFDEMKNEEQFIQIKHNIK